MRLFLLRGYKYVSLVDVANEIGITKGGIYHYFASKEELLQAAVQLLFDDLKAKFLEMFSQDKSLREILQAVIVEQEIENYFKCVLGIEQDIDRINGANFILEVMQCYPNIHERIDNDQIEICNAIARALQQAAQRGEIRDDVDIDALAVIIFTIVNGHRPVDVFFKDRDKRTRIMETVCKLLEVQ